MNKGSIYFNEFKDIFHNSDDYLKDDGMNLMYEMNNSLLSMTEEERTKFLKNFKFKIENERLENNQCPKCSIDLEYITKKDNEWLEYFGTPCSQTYTYKRCDNCGWRDDK